MSGTVSTLGVAESQWMLRLDLAFDSLPKTIGENDATGLVLSTNNEFRKDVLKAMDGFIVDLALSLQMVDVSLNLGNTRFKTAEITGRVELTNVMTHGRRAETIEVELRKSSCKHGKENQSYQDWQDVLDPGVAVTGGMC